MNFELSQEQLQYFANVIKNDISSYVQNHKEEYLNFVQKENKDKEEKIGK